MYSTESPVTELLRALLSTTDKKRQTIPREYPLYGPILHLALDAVLYLLFRRTGE